MREVDIRQSIIKQQLTNGNQMTTNNQLIAYDKIGDVPSFVTSLGKSIALSKMFGCESEEQGHIMALECIAKKMPPLSIAEKYHLIHGKLSMKTEAMLADFRTVAKGMHRVICRTPDKVAIELITADRQSHEFELTWAEAKREPFVYEGKESTVVDQINSGKIESLKLKAKYATDRSRMQMLWARLVSDSIRCIAPEVICGTYTPEEVSDFDQMPEVIRNDQPVEAEEIEEAETTAGNITFETTVEPEEEEKPVEPFDENTAESMSNNDPALSTQIDAIKDALAVAKQTPGLEDIVGRVKAKLIQHGMEKLSDLTQGGAVLLLKSINKKHIEAFFDADLKTHGGTPAKN